MEKINITEILKDCPKGTKLYSPLSGECKLERIHNELKKIIVSTSDGTVFSFYNDGKYFQMDNSECLLFPSKDQRDWSKFQQHFKDGDIISNGRYVAIFHKTGKPENCVNSNVVYYHCWYNNKYTYNKFKAKIDFGIGIIEEYKYATEKEKQKLFDAIKKNGYKWNEETKTLEKVLQPLHYKAIQPKFKVGDIVQSKTVDMIGTITLIDNDEHDYQVALKKGGITYILFEFQDNWELVKDNIKPKFKIGDKIVKKNGITVPILITGVSDDYYSSKTEKYVEVLPVADQDDWELFTNKFDTNTLKPFESRVLVRDYDHQCWRVSFFGYFDKFMGKFDTVRGVYIQCIPYEGNEHLLNTNKDCDEYYKNW